MPAIKKQHLLIAASVLLAIISYELAFKNTINLWEVHRKLQEQSAQANDISVQPGYLSRKNRNLDRIIKSYRLDSVVFRNNIVNKIAELAEPLQVNLVTIPFDDLLYHTPRFIIQKVNFEGDFFALLKLVNKLQNTNDIGILRSVSWKTRKTFPGDNKPQKLNLEIYMEMYR